MHFRFSQLHAEIVKSYEVTANNGPVMSPEEAAEVSRLARLYNGIIFGALMLMRDVDHPTIEVVSQVAGENQLGFQWRPFMGADGRVSGCRLREVTL